MHTDEAGSEGPFITAYGEHPLVVMTEFAPGSGRALACIVRPPELRTLGSGANWNEAHWDLFNALLSDYMNLDRNRSQLDPENQRRLFHLDCLRDDGTLRLVAAIARSGFPPELHHPGVAAPTRIESPG